MGHRCRVSTCAAPAVIRGAGSWARRAAMPRSGPSGGGMSTSAAPHFKKPLLETPFHARARDLSQVDSFVAWAGYTTVDVFTTVEQEYFAIRNATTLYDLTPMVKYRIAGPDAVPYLNRLVTRDVTKLKPDRVAYCVWCNDAGHLVDDGTVFRWARANTVCARRSGRSTGCWIPPSASP